MTAAPGSRPETISRRRLVARLAGMLGVAMTAAPIAALAPMASAHPLGTYRACACSGGGSSATAAGSAQVARPQAVVRKQGAAFENRVGWAYNLRWRKSRTEVLAEFQRMRAFGCNIVYIGHNSAGDANPDAYEPGITPACWYAIAASTPSAGDARIVVGALHTALDAAREAGLDVLLGIGYQIMMGDEWNAANASELRLDRNGDPLIHWESVYTASPYSEVYRRDIREYYAWINETFVLPNPHVVALSLADEPMGTDFSSHAMAAFRTRYGLPFEQATATQRGEFLNGVIADYASWSANHWEWLNPDVRTMMTFHVQRDQPFLPDIERIFAQTPPTFVFSEDTHLDDGLIDRRITPENVRLLYGMCRTFGWLSQVYRKPLMLWTGANAWSLKKSGGLPEARQNIEIVHDATKLAGGQIAMLMAWGWNIRHQGVYDDEGNFAADKETMIEGVSRLLVERRDQLSAPSLTLPERVYYLPAARLQPAIGERRIDHLLDGMADLRSIPFEQENAVYLTDGRALEAARRLSIPITQL